MLSLLLSGSGFSRISKSSRKWRQNSVKQIITSFSSSSDVDEVNVNIISPDDWYCYYDDRYPKQTVDTTKHQPNTRLHYTSHPRSSLAKNPSLHDCFYFYYQWNQLLPKKKLYSVININKGCLYLLLWITPYEFYFQVLVKSLHKKYWEHLK